MAAFSVVETGEDNFSLTAGHSRSLNSQTLSLSSSTSITLFSAAQFSGVQIWAFDQSLAQRYLAGNSITGFLLNADGQYGLTSFTLPAGNWAFGAQYNGSLSNGASIKGFEEVSIVTLPGQNFIGNVPMAVSGNAGAWVARGFTITGSPATHIETEGTGGSFMIMDDAQYLAFQSSYPAGFFGGTYSYTYALGGTNGGPATEIEGEMLLPAGHWNLVWINDSGSWAGGAANISAFGNAGSVIETGTPTPLPSLDKTLTGTNAGESLVGGAGNDTITGRGGNDVIDGGGGVNTSIYTGASKGYAITVNSTSATVRDKIGSEGTDTLSNIQKIQFTDFTLDLASITKAASLTAAQFASLVEVYIASFNRAPDALGLDYWAGRLKDGMTLPDIAKSFFGQPETTAKYPASTTNTSFVTTVYGNVLGRAPDADGLKYWTGELANGHVSRDTFLLAILNGAHANPGATQDIANLNNKVAVGEHFALAQGLNNGTWSQQVMAGVTSAASTVTAANAMTDTFAATAAASATSELVVKILGIVA